MKRIWLGLVGVLLLGALVSCGDDTPSSANDDSTESGSTGGDLPEPVMGLNSDAGSRW